MGVRRVGFMMPTTQLNRFEVRRADERGQTELGWLHSRHSFSFGRYYDPANMAYRRLRVLNDDVVEPGGGFGEHPHDNMEIITWVLDGSLRHADSTGGGGVIGPGDVQVMTAGRGIRHSEFNASGTERVHLLQVWIEPDTRDLPPAYAQRNLPRAGRQGRWQTLASPDGRADSLRIHQNATLSVAELSPQQRIEVTLDEQRHGYLHVVLGAIRVGDTTLRGGDAITFAGPATLDLRATEPSQVLLFDLA